MDNILLLLHPAIVTTPEVVDSVKRDLAFQYGQAKIDQNLFERVTRGEAELEASHYDLVHYLAPIEAKSQKLPGAVFALIFNTLKPRGVFQGCLCPESKMDGILAGFLVSDTKWTRPDSNLAVSLRRREKSSTKKLPTFKKLASPALTDTSDLGEEESDSSVKIRESKLTFFDYDENDETLDEDELMKDELDQPIIVPAQCRPTDGKRRKKACKDCTCGLKEVEEEEENGQRKVQNSLLSKMARSANDEAQAIENRIKFTQSDLTEVDFTIEGKKGGCGSCSLGDAFRCDGCPYLGLPPFKPGEAISIDMLGEDI